MTAPSTHPRVVTEPYGDAAVLVTVVGGEREERWRIVQHLAQATLVDPPAGFVDCVSAFDTLLLELDTRPGVHDAARAWVDRVWPAVDHDLRHESRLFTIPVLFGGDAGPDLDEVASELGLTPEAVVAEHCARTWTVRLVASPACAPMMDGGDWPQPIPRRADPRVSIPPGSIALSGQQCVIYPLVAPGGWRLIGRTPLALTDVSEQPPVVYRPGDILRFVPIGHEEWDALTGSRLVRA